jgi:hypothetical protein
MLLCSAFWWPIQRIEEPFDVIVAKINTWPQTIRCGTRATPRGHTLGTAH